MVEKRDRPHNENQLQIAFFRSSRAQLSPGQEQAWPVGTLADLLPQLHAALLQASVDEVDQELTPVLELCEVLLTRALDSVERREGSDWSY